MKANDMCEVKECLGCSETMPVEMFYKSSHGAFQARCKACFNKKTSYVARGYSRNTLKKRHASKKWRIENRDKTRAHNKLNGAILRGDITRPDICERCEEYKPVHGHHEDYSKPLVVIWLCRGCHTNEHNRLKTKSPLDQEGEGA